MTTYYVSNLAINGYALGSNSNNGTSQSTPFLTIAHAISVAVNNDIITVNPTSNSIYAANNPYLESGTGLATGGTSMTIMGDPAYVNYTSGSIAVVVIQSASGSSIITLTGNETTLNFTDLIIDSQSVSGKRAFAAHAQPSVTFTRIIPVNMLGVSTIYTGFSGASNVTFDRCTLDPSTVWTSAYASFTSMTSGTLTIKGGTYGAAPLASTLPVFAWRTGGVITTVTVENDINGNAPQITGNYEFLSVGGTGTLNVTAANVQNCFQLINIASTSNTSYISTVFNVSNVTCVAGALSSTGSSFFFATPNELCVLGTFSNNTIDGSALANALGYTAFGLPNGTGSPLVFNNTITYNSQSHAFVCGTDGFPIDQSNTATSTGGQKLGDVTNDKYVAFNVTTSAASTSGHCSYIAEVVVTLEKVGTPTGTITCTLNANNAGVPGTLLATSATTLSSASLTTGYLQYAFEFTPAINVTGGTEIFVVFEYNGTASTSNYVNMSQNTTVTTGSILTAPDGSTWTPNTSNQLLFFLNTGAYGIVDAQIYNNTVICTYDDTASITHMLAMGAQTRGKVYGNRIYGGSLGVLFKENKGGSASNPAAAYNNLMYLPFAGGSSLVSPFSIKASQYVTFSNNIGICGSASTGAVVLIEPDANSFGYTPVNSLQSDHIIVENNIIVQSNATAGAYLIIENGLGAAPTNVTINNNDVYLPNGGNIGVLTTSTGTPVTTYATWSAWQGAGYDTNGVNTNPLLPTLTPSNPATIGNAAYAASFSPSLSSPAKGIGTNTNGLVTTDYNGNPYPFNPDAGAFSITYNAMQALFSSVFKFNPFTNNLDEVGLTGSNAAQLFMAIPSTVVVSATSTLPSGANQNVTYLVNSSAGNITLTLPLTTSANNSVLNIKKTSSDSNTITITAAGSDSIDGAATKTITTQYTNYELQAYAPATTWEVL
jgi:hypothetical protein